MGPAQLCPQCGHNLGVGEGFSEVEAVAELSGAPAFAVGLGELLGEGFEGLFAVLGALALEDLGLDALADLPVELGEFGVDGGGGALFGAVDQLADFLEEGVAGWG